MNALHSHEEEAHVRPVDDRTDQAATPDPAAEAMPAWLQQLNEATAGATGAAPATPSPDPIPAQEPAAAPESESARATESRAKQKLAGRRRAKGRGTGVKVTTRQRGLHRRAQVVGLKIGASQIAAAAVSNNGSSELVKLAREPLAPGIVVGGELREPEALTQALKMFFKKHKLPKRGIRLGIASNRIGVRTFDLPEVEDPKQLENAIRFRAQEALPIPVEHAVLDYQILDGPDGREQVLLVVTYRELVQGFVTACRNAGLTLVGIDLEAFAVLRALSAPRHPSDPPEAAVVAVAIGHDRSTVAVSNGRSCEFTRVLDWGGANVNVAIGRALHVAPSEAEPVKRAITFGGSAPDGIPTESFRKAQDAVRTEIHSFTRELVSSLQFYQDQADSLEIGEIVVTGGTAELDGLAPELERLIGVSVRVGDPLARVRVGKKVKHDGQIGSHAVAIGLGIED